MEKTRRTFHPFHSCFCCLSDIRGFTGCSSKPFTHTLDTHWAKIKTRSNSGFIILLKVSLWSPRGSSRVWWEGSNQWPLDGRRDRYSARASDHLTTHFDRWNAKFFYSSTAPCTYKAWWRWNVHAQFWVRARAPNGVSCPWSNLFERVYHENILPSCLVILLSLSFFFPWIMTLY